MLLVLLIFQHIAIWGQTGHFVPSERFSSGLINDLCQDRYGYMWIATDYGLNRYDGYRFIEYQHQPEDTTTICSSNAICLLCDKDGQLWVGTSKGLDRYDYGTGHFVHYPFERGMHPRVTKMTQLKDGRLVVATSGYHGLYYIRDGMAADFNEGDTKMPFVNSVFEDSQGRLWQCNFGEELTMKETHPHPLPVSEGSSHLHRMKSTQGFVVDFVERQRIGNGTSGIGTSGMRDGEVLIICLHGFHSYKDGRLTVPDIDMSAMGSDAVIRRVFADSQGNIYIGTRGDGLYRLPAKSNKLERVEAVANGMNLNSAKIWAITEDRQHNIWLGCQSKGLMMLSAQQSQFSAWTFNSQGIDIASAITSVCEGDGGHVWCTVQGNGIYGFDAFGRIIAHPSSPANVECIYRTSEGYYWIGTDDALYAYDPLTGRSEKIATFDCDKINAITDDRKGNLYFSTFSKGFWKYDTLSKELKHFDSHDCGLCNNWVMAMKTDRNGCLWIATSSGVSCYDPQTDQFQQVQLEGILCFSLCQTHKGDILVGTEQGLYRLTTGQEAELLGLDNKTVGYIIEAQAGIIWCSTSKGIWQYDLTQKTFIGHVNGNGLTAREYLNGVGLNTTDGRICFATNNGLAVFRPTEVTGSHTTLPNVKLTGLYVADKAMSTLSDHYFVSYLDNSMQLEFSLLDFNNPGNIIFEHRINDGSWQQNQEGQNTIQLNHLQPGTYNVEVRALSAGSYSPVTTITIDVTPPWWRSTWAYVVYFLCVIGLLGLIGLMWRRRANRRFEEDKMRFLINATHDIRSPLTLIMGAVGKLKNLNVNGLNADQLSTLDAQLSTTTDAIDRNAQRLLQLVNQILDERRIDKNQMQLHCRETNMIGFINGICKLYEFTANERNITFTFEDKTNHSPLSQGGAGDGSAWIDRIQFDKVISNLLSNAFKYTPDGGEVKVTLSETDNDIVIQVADNGIGFKNENPERLFERFYQGRNAEDIGMHGTGIGLNLSRAITLMHGGQIKATHHDGGGALFTVTLPKGNNHLKPEQIEAESNSPITIHHSQLSTASKGVSSSSSKPRILIADDEHEIADYIITELGHRYKFDYAPNGKEALKLLLTAPYDLVISDVMMPEMDGFTLLKRIKDNPQISQLPVIMLTSKSEVEHKLEGLKSGADAYIAKPFDMEELHIQIDNLIDSVRRLRGKFSGAVSQEERLENIEVKGNDETLMERIMQVVNARMSDPEFNVEVLASEVGLSRAQLHRRMKDITGIASGKFLRNLRMEQAARLLREGKVNISQVAYSVGYSDLAQFSTAFKTHFGQSPSEYAETHK